MIDNANMKVLMSAPGGGSGERQGFLFIIRALRMLLLHSARLQSSAGAPVQESEGHEAFTL
jgi:hypothetical protein